MQSVFLVWPREDLTWKSNQDRKIEKKKFKGLLARLNERALTISCLFSIANHVFSQPNSLQSLSLLLLITNTSTQWGPIFRKEAARFSWRLGALGTELSWMKIVVSLNVSPNYISFTDWLLVVSLAMFLYFNRSTGCFESYMNISCRSTQTAAHIKRF